MDVLSKHRGGLNAIARALLDNEIIDGAEVARLVDEAHGSPVHDGGLQVGPALPRGGHRRAGRQRDQRQRQRQRQRSNGQHAVTDGSPGHEHGHEHGHHPVTDGTPAADEGPVAVPGNPSDPADVGSPALASPGQPRQRHPGGTCRPLGMDTGSARMVDRGRIEPIRATQRHEGGWWSTSSRTGSRTATWRPSAPPA